MTRLWRSSKVRCRRRQRAKSGLHTTTSYYKRRRGAHAWSWVLCCEYVPWLDTEGHDRVDNVVVVLLERLDGLLPRYVGLRHDELDVLVLDALGIHLLAIIFLLLGGLLVGVTTLDSLARLAVVVARVVVLSGGKLLGGRGLGGGVKVLDLGLTEDAVGKEVSDWRVRPTER